MLDEKDLQAIASMMDTKFESFRSEMGKDNEVFRTQMSKENEAFRTQTSDVIQSLRTEMKENNKTLLNQFNAVLESQIIPQIKIIAEGHQTLLERLPNADTTARLEQRVDVLEFTTKAISQEVKKLQG